MRKSLESVDVVHIKLLSVLFLACRLGKLRGAARFKANGYIVLGVTSRCVKERGAWPFGGYTKLLSVFSCWQARRSKPKQIGMKCSI